MKLHKIIKNVGLIVSENEGKEKAGRIMAAAQKRYEELTEENSGDSKALRAHTYRRIYPCIALYEVMRKEGIDSEKSVWYIREYFLRYCAEAVPHLQRLIKVLGLAKKMPKIFMKIALSGFSPEAGFGYEFPESHGNECRFNIVRCPYFETCSRYGCPEIVKAFCDSDDAEYGNLHPKLKWGRTKTIGRGGDCCNFLLEYRE